MVITEKQLNIVIGHPLAHTKSPALHELVYKYIGVNATLLPFSHPDIRKLIAAIRTLSIKLSAVTMPFKQSAMSLVDKIDSPAQKVGAINTIINRNGKLIGYNTDVFGIEYALRDTPIKNKNVLVIGAGGAASAVAYVVKKKRGKLIYVNRTQERSKGLQKKFGGRVARISELESKDIDIIINATPIGMFPRVKKMPVPKTLIGKHQTVFDLVYNPFRTGLLRSAEKKGAIVISGINMFTAQGTRQIELWTGKKIINERLVARLNKQILKTMP
jgi:shikimate dehydrogenase